MIVLCVIDPEGNVMHYSITLSKFRLRIIFHRFLLAKAEP